MFEHLFELLRNPDTWNNEDVSLRGNTTRTHGTLPIDSKRFCLVLWIVQNAIADDHDCQQEFIRYHSRLFLTILSQAQEASKNFGEQHLTEECLVLVSNYIEISGVGPFLFGNISILDLIMYLLSRALQTESPTEKSKF